MKPFLIVILLIVNGFLSFSQEGTQIKRNKQFYIYGNTAVIGNNIVSKHATKPFNSELEINDEIKMTYVNIDRDPSTFSSSQATLKLPKNKTNIVYAALYWSAVYKYDYGEFKLKGNAKVYTGDESTRNPKVNVVKLKMSDKSYQAVVGKDRPYNFCVYSCYHYLFWLIYAFIHSL